MDCAENSTCCPDYAEYCILGIILIIKLLNFHFLNSFFFLIILDTTETVDIVDLNNTLIPFESTNAPGRDDIKIDENLHYSIKTIKIPTPTISKSTKKKYSTEKINTMETIFFVTKKTIQLSTTMLPLKIDKTNSSNADLQKSKFYYNYLLK